MSGVADLLARAVKLRALAAKPRRLAAVATLSPEDVHRLLQFADELEREASDLEGDVERNKV